METTEIISLGAFLIATLTFIFVVIVPKVIEARKKKFPRTDWLIGKDVMRIHNITAHQLSQYIDKENGLPVYPENTDTHYKDTQPMDLETIWFLMGVVKTEADTTDFLEKKLPNLMFKVKDIDQYLKKKKNNSL